ncbi:MAG: hypothetical protein JNK74_02720 [Candidatus Hydrogenedentes bacterium]|nr:hypothetical protein [Candidatus Hydrogenedentota bacterium]
MVNREFRITDGKTMWIAVLLFASLWTAIQPVHGEEQLPEEAELQFELPEPFFGGTPLDGWFPNLEEFTYKERPPFKAPVGTAIVSRQKPVSSSASPLRGKLEQVVDGKKGYEPENVLELPEGLQWTQVDLQEEFEVYAILLWHNFRGIHIYFDVIGQASNDPEFKKDVTEFYNNDIDNTSHLGAGKDKEYLERNYGRLFDLKGIKARYIRFYGNGNTNTSTNQVVEIEVWGKKSDN